jgi:hypothetical protein
MALNSASDFVSKLGSSINLDVSGNVGINNASPGAQLDVTGLVHLLYNAPSTRPASVGSGGLSISSNYSNGSNEVDFWNVYNSAYVAFHWKQKTGASTHTDLATLGTGGFVVGAPTGGEQGGGTINAQGVFVNGVSVLALGGAANRIINGEMLIDQRNAGGSISLGAGGSYITDRFIGFRSGGSGTLSGQQVNNPGMTASMQFPKVLKFTVGTGAAPGSTDFTYFQHRIEGLNVADLAFGTASAKTITLSFWVYASVTGTFCVAFSNSAANRSYVATYTVNAANTWEQKTVTIPGDTTGTWLTDTGIGLTVTWDLGVGSSYQGTAGSWQAANLIGTSAAVKLISTAGATFHISGVQLQEGSSAINFVRRPYGQELSLCERYYETGVQPYLWLSALQSSGGTAGYGSIQFRTKKRVNPSISVSGWQYFSAGSPASYTPGGIGSVADRFTYQCTGATNYSGEVGTGTWTANSEL